MSFAQSTKKTYGSGMRQFFTFCSQMNINLQLTIREDISINFSVTMAPSTIKNYLLAVKKTIPAMAMTFSYLISFVSSLFFKELSVHRGHSQKCSRCSVWDKLASNLHYLNQRSDRQDGRGAY